MAQRLGLKAHGALTVAVTVVLVVGIHGVEQHRRTSATLLEGATHRTALLAHALADRSGLAAYFGDLDAVGQLNAEVARTPEVMVTAVLSESGQPLAVWRSPRLRSLDNVRVLALLHTASMQADRRLSLDGVDCVAVRAATSDGQLSDLLRSLDQILHWPGKGRLPTALVAVSLERVRAEVRRQALQTGAVDLALALAAIGTIVLLFNRLVRSITRISDAAMKLADGQLTTRVAEPGRNEIGDLARAFNQMAEKVESSHAQLTEEKSSQERTNQVLMALSSGELEAGLQLLLDVCCDQLQLTTGWVSVVEKGNPRIAAAKGLPEGIDLACDACRECLAVAAESQMSLVECTQMGATQPVLVTPLCHEHVLLGAIELVVEGRSPPSPATRAFVDSLARAALLAMGRAALQRRTAEQWRWMELLVRNLPDAVLLIDPQGRTMLANPKAERIDPELFQRGPAGATRSIGGLPLAEMLQRARRGPVEVVLPDPHRSFVIAVARLATGSVETGECVVVIRETTAERERERRMVQQERLAVVGELAGGIAHDFNNLLTVIMSCASLLAASHPVGEDHQDAMNIISTARRASNLVGQLLAFGRRGVCEPVVLDLNAVVTGMEKILRRTLGEDIQLLIDLEPTLVPVKADPGQLEQVVLNLAVNARDAMPQGGSLTIRTGNAEMDPRRVQQLQLVSPGPHALLSVTDTGVGMTEQVAARVFEPFFTTKPVGKGTGLGLSTVYGIVKQSSGGIWLSTKPGAGTTFDIFLPATTEAETQREAAPTASASPGNGEVVLLVEDETAVRRATARILRNGGYGVLEASSGAEALELAAHQAPIHLVLTDMVMPQMGGWELATRLEATGARVPILFMSGHADDKIGQRGLGHLSGSLLRKPFTTADLLQRVSAALQGHRE